LAGPVLPVVNRMAAMSLRRVLAAAKGVHSRARSCFSVGPPQNQRRPTVTRQRTVLKAFRKTERAACASGMPTKAWGRVERKHSSMRRIPMPGRRPPAAAPRNGEDEGKELEARPHHQDGARARADSGFEQPVGDLVGLPVELLEAQVGIGDAARGIAAGRADHGAFEGVGLRHACQVAGHVHASVG
jgi:hypothetical protein